MVLHNGIASAMPFLRPSFASCLRLLVPFKFPQKSYMIGIFFVRYLPSLSEARTGSFFTNWLMASVLCFLHILYGRGTLSTDVRRNEGGI